MTYLTIIKKIIYFPFFGKRCVQEPHFIVYVKWDVNKSVAHSSLRRVFEVIGTRGDGPVILVKQNLSVGEPDVPVVFIPLSV